MSSGQFVRTGYESDSGKVYSIKVQPETLTSWNTGTPTNPTEETSAHATNRKGVGMFARQVSLKWSGNPPVPPNNYFPYGTIRVPVLTKADFQALGLGQSVQYLGASAIVTGFIPERRG
jgi:hypothetical protein